jgi:uncharacterized protein (TIGR02147 family)
MACVLASTEHCNLLSSRQAFYSLRRDLSSYKILKEELAKRCEKNHRYSVRAFAKALAIDVGALSRILGGKQIPSFRVTQQVLSQLDLAPEQEQDFLASIAETQRRRGLQRLSPLFKNLGARMVQSDLSIDLYRVIADWYHVAILELTFTKDFNSDPKWIADNLGISQCEAKLAIDRLLNLELLRIENGKLVKSNEQLTTTDKTVTTPALKKNQKQFLKKATESLENDPIEERNMTSMTMAIDPEKLPEAKQMIRAFNKTLCEFLESGKRSRVYNLGIALYPIQKKQE